MIAKKIIRNSGRSRAAYLVKYMVAAQGGADPESWKRTADYILDTNAATGKGEKVSSFRVTNCGTDDPAQATTIIEATQAINTTSKADKTFHLVFSFPPGEKPPLEVLHVIEDELVESIGYRDHQRVSAVHIDTDHLHVHVAINKVHPVGFQNIECYRDQWRLMQACERIEEKHNLIRTNHGLGKEGSEKQKQRLSGKAADMEAYSGIESMIGFIRQEVFAEMLEANSWDELHQILEKHGLQIKKRGDGLVIGNGIWCKASQVSRDFSKGALEQRFGTFSKYSVDHPQENRQYKSRPKQEHPLSTALFAQYQAERQEYFLAKKQGLTKIALERKLENERIKQWASSQRALIKWGSSRALRKIFYSSIATQAAAARQANKSRFSKQRNELLVRNRLLTWNEWLVERADGGDLDALAILRARAAKEEKIRGDLLTAEKAERAKAIIFNNLKAQTRRDGVVSYRTADGGVVLDRATCVQAKQVTAGSALVALTLASKRFEGQALVVKGSEQFKSDVARLACVHGIKVVFADSEMEKIRRANNGERKKFIAREMRQAKKTEKTEKTEQASSEDIKCWIDSRNDRREQIPSILPHRLWSSTDVGKAIYRGRRKISNGSEVILLERNGEMLVKSSSARVVAKASRWKVGKTVTLDRKGRFIDHLSLKEEVDVNDKNQGVEL